MPDTKSSPPKKTVPVPSGAKDPSMDMRLLLAFVLMGLVLVGTQYFYKPDQKAVKPAAATPPAQTQQPQQPPAAPQPGAPTPPAAKAAKLAKPGVIPPPQVVAAQNEEPYVVETDLYRVEFTNKGAVVRSWVLKKFKDNTGKPLELVNRAAKDKVWYPFTIDFKDNKDAADSGLNLALFVPKPASDGRGIEYDYSNGHITVKKAFRFTPSSYLVQVRSEAILNNVAIPHLLQWRGGFGDPVVYNAWSTQHTVWFDPAKNKLHTNAASEAKNGPVSVSGDFEFAGLEDNYFAAVQVARSSASQMELRTYSDTVPAADAKGGEQPHVGAGLGSGAMNDFKLFVGPKDDDLLKSVDPKLGQIVQWGWFGFLAKPIFIALNWINDNWVHNYGWSIILVTILISILLFPLRLSSLKSAKKSQALQPRIQALNEKYKGISIKDPRKAQQNEEMMALYKEAGINPLGGCLPLAMQLPFLYAIYTVLSVSIEMRGAQWLWVTDLSQPEHLPIHILPVVFVATQVVMQKMTPPAPGQDPTQQKMMMFMPLMLGYFFYSMSSGLMLYWLTSNVVGIVQQWVINRVTPVPAAPSTPTTTNKRTRK
jgi:YidC/Oxa1 family membrane protein insertase